MKHIILSISDSDKHFDSAIAEYKKRMPKELDIINIKPTKHGTTDQIIAKETDSLISKILKLKKQYPESKIFLLAKWWKVYNTIQWSKKLDMTKTYIYIIWGPYGMDEYRLASYTYQSISFGAHTMPHGLAKLVLVEQLYRIGTIYQGKQYHY